MIKHTIYKVVKLVQRYTVYILDRLYIYVYKKGNVFLEDMLSSFKSSHYVCWSAHIRIENLS